MRLLVANDPRAYRDVMAATFRRLRPDVDVVVAEPEALGIAIEHHRPQMVVCSRLVDAVIHHVPSWVVLYPEGQRLVHVNIANQHSTAVDIDLVGLLSLIDQTCQPATRDSECR